MINNALREPGQVDNRVLFNITPVIQHIFGTIPRNNMNTQKNPSLYAVWSIVYSTHDILSDSCNTQAYGSALPPSPPYKDTKNFSHFQIIFMTMCHTALICSLFTQLRVFLQICKFNSHERELGGVTVCHIPL